MRFIQNHALEEPQAPTTVSGLKPSTLLNLRVRRDDYVGLFLRAKTKLRRNGERFLHHSHKALSYSKLVRAYQVLASFKTLARCVSVSLLAAMTTLGAQCFQRNNRISLVTSANQVVSSKVFGQTMRAFRMVPADMRPNRNAAAWRVFPETTKQIV